MLGHTVVFLGSLFLVGVVTEFLTPKEYGMLALGMTVFGLVNQVVVGGVIAGISRYYSIATDKHDLDGYLSASFRVMMYAALVAIALGGFLIFLLYAIEFYRWVDLTLAVLIYSILTVFSSTVSSIQNAARQRAIVAFHGGLDAWLKILLAIGFIVWVGASSTAVVLGYACSALLVLLSQIFFLCRSMSLQINSTKNCRYWMVHLWEYSQPFCIWGLFTWMHLVSDRWALQSFATSSDVGVYAVLFQLGFTPVIMITGVATNFKAPILYQRSGDGSDKTRNTEIHQVSLCMSYLSLLLTLLGFSITFALHKELFALIVGKDYWYASHLLPWVVLSGGIFNTGQMLALKLMNDLKTRALGKVKVITAIVGTITNIVGASFAGVEGVIASLTLFSILYLFWMYILVNRLAK